MALTSWCYPSCNLWPPFYPFTLRPSEQLQMPSFALLSFNVFAKRPDTYGKTQDDHIAVAVFPATVLREGFRIIQLHREDMTVPSEYRRTFLFIYTEVTNISKSTINRQRRKSAKLESLNLNQTSGTPLPGARPQRRMSAAAPIPGQEPPAGDAEASKSMAEMAAAAAAEAEPAAPTPNGGVSPPGSSPRTGSGTGSGTSTPRGNHSLHVGKLLAETENAQRPNSAPPKKHGKGSHKLFGTQDSGASEVGEEETKEATPASKSRPKNAPGTVPVSKKVIQASVAPRAESTNFSLALSLAQTTTSPRTRPEKQSSPAGVNVGDIIQKAKSGTRSDWRPFIAPLRSAVHHAENSFSS